MAPKYLLLIVIYFSFFQTCVLRIDNFVKFQVKRLHMDLFISDAAALLAMRKLNGKIIPHRQPVSTLSLVEPFWAWIWAYFSTNLSPFEFFLSQFEPLCAHLNPFEPIWIHLSPVSIEPKFIPNLGNDYANLFPFEPKFKLSLAQI